MEHERTTCERVDRDELDTRYLAGTLGEAEALAFEAHYFECDRCWNLVHRGTEVRAAAAPAPAASTAGPTAAEGGPRGRVQRWRRWTWIPVLAAAALAVVWVRTSGGGPARAVEPGAELRSAGDGLTVTSRVESGNLTAAWSRVPAASSYQILFFDTSGAVLWERRVVDTALAIRLDSVAIGWRGPLLGQVRALDLMGATIARSALVDVATTPESR